MNGCSPKGAGLGLFDRPRFLSRSGAAASDGPAIHCVDTAQKVRVFVQTYILGWP